MLTVFVEKGVERLVVGVVSGYRGERFTGLSLEEHGEKKGVFFAAHFDRIMSRSFSGVHDNETTIQSKQVLLLTRSSSSFVISK